MTTPTGYRLAIPFSLLFLTLSACTCPQIRPLQAAKSQPAPGSILPLSSGLPGKPGTYGEPMVNRALFQECSSLEGVEYCAFHADGWKLYAYANGPTPEWVLTKLAALPVNTPVALTSDLIFYGDITAEIALRRVEHDLQGDTYASLRKKLQGTWVSLDDPQARISIAGSEVRNEYAGEMLGHDFLQISDHCAEAPPEAGPLLLLTNPEQHGDPPLCYGINSANAVLELIYMGRGTTLRYQRQLTP